MNVCIAGVAHTPFQKHEMSLEQLIVSVVEEALQDAGVLASDIDEFFIGHFNAGMDAQDFVSSLALQADDALRFVPVNRLENACASGSAAVHAGVRAVASGQSRRVLVIGAEKMSGCKNVGAALARASYLEEEADFDSFAALFAEIARQYFDRHGNQEEAMARIAAKNHHNGLDNPFAQLRKPFDEAFCLQVSDKNPLVAGRLKRTDCSPVSDGAAAMVLCHQDLLPVGSRSVAFEAISQVNDYLPMSRRDMSRLEGCEQAWQRALQKAQLKDIWELDFVETHDCFTIAELMQYEAMGLTGPGEGFKALQEGWVYADGRLPINRSGGLKSKGHPIGATGVSMHVMAALQLRNDARDMQLQGVQRGGVFNMGGSGVANYVSILSARQL